MDRIANLLEKFKKTKIAVIGDLISDEYWIGEANRISPEAPVPILDLKEQITTMGGAGNVWQNLRNLGCEVDLYANYPKAWNKIWDWTAEDSLYLNDYPCSRKVRMMAGNTQLLRMDVETPFEQIEWHQFNHFSWWRELTEKFESYDVIVMSDYGKGICSDGVINTIVDFAQMSKKVIVVDAKRDFHRYNHRCCFIKCNDKEFRSPTGIPWTVRRLLVTRGEKGMSFFGDDSLIEIDGYKSEVIDVCGAGDTVTAVLAIAIAAGETDLSAANFANIAASEIVRHPRVAAITPEMFKKRYNEIHHEE